MKHSVLIMGVSGSGKSSVGKLLADNLGLQFIEGDDYHSEANKSKMKHGQPLTDRDRSSWLAALAELMHKSQHNGFVVACSALKAKYRKVLQSPLQAPLHIFHLHGDKQLIKERMVAREHYMPVGLLDSQFETLEITDELHTLDIRLTVEELIKQILISLEKQ